MGQGAPVFTLRPGSVTIIRTDPQWASIRGLPQPAAVSDGEVLAAFEAARAAYPGLVGDPVIAAPAATLRWRSGGAGMTRNCSEPAGFELAG